MKQILPALEATFASVVWGVSFVATKIALTHASPVSVVWIRFALGVLVLGIAVLWRSEFLLPRRSEWGYFALLGFIGITFHQWLQANGLRTSQASTTAWILTSIPVFLALLGWLFLGERIDRNTILGITLAALGVILVVTRGDWQAILRGHLGAPGDLLILLSAPNWAVFSILSRQGLKEHPAARMMFYVMLLGWLFTTFWWLGTGSWREWAGLTSTTWLSLLFLGIFSSGLAYIAWYDALQALTAARTGVFLYLEPLAAMVVGAWLLNERITPLSLLGGLGILTGVYLVNHRQCT
jgi:drug/metabolite transporter (DMT)-like permease